MLRCSRRIELENRSRKQRELNWSAPLWAWWWWWVQSDGRENGRDHQELFDIVDKSQSARATGAFENIYSPNPEHKLRPCVISACDTVWVFLVAEELRLQVKVDVAQWFRSTVGDDLLSILSPGRKSPVVHDEIGLGSGYQWDQFFN